MKPKKIFAAMMILFCTLFHFTEVDAENIKLPAEYYENLSIMREDILKSDFLVCGNSKIGQKNTFISNFFQGYPARGFLIMPPLVNNDLKRIIRSEKDIITLTSILTDKFSRMALISIDQNFEQIIKIKNSEFEIKIPELLHECLVDQNKKWGCGIAENRCDECCEKKLGSPIIKAVWNDITKNETYTLLYRLEKGNSILIRTQQDKKTIYSCINSESFSFIK